MNGLKLRALMWRITPRLIAMLNSLPKESQKVFGPSPTANFKTTFLKARKRLAFKLQNPRPTRISFTLSDIGKPQTYTIKPKMSNTFKGS